MLTAYRFWRNKVQRSIRAAKYQYYSTKVTDVQKVNPTKWWREIKKLSGQSIKPEWHHQFLENSSDTKLLANRMTDYFEPLTPRIVSQEAPQEFLVTENEAYRALSLLQVNKSFGTYHQRYL